MASKTGTAALAPALLGALLASSASALDARLDLSAQSAYIWRGMLIDDRPVFQPSLTVADGAVTGSVWANLNLTSGNGYQGEASEIDYWLAYTFAGQHADLTVTYYAYTFPHTASDSTQEVWANVTLKDLPFAPSFSAIRDVDVIDGWYFLLTGSQRLGLLKTRASDGLLLTLNVGHGTKEYCRGYFPEAERQGVTDYGVRLDWPVKAGPGTLDLDVQYTDFAEKGIYSPGFAGKRAAFVGGLTYSIPLQRRP
jgi:hypothetical protein